MASSFDITEALSSIRRARSSLIDFRPLAPPYNDGGRSHQAEYQHLRLSITTANVPQPDYVSKVLRRISVKSPPSVKIATKMSAPQIHKFQSPSTPSRSVSYAHLNPGAPHTLLFCYGAAASSTLMGVYIPFANTHKDLSLLCIDRWTQGADAARSGPSLLSELSTISLELLDSLQIDKFSIAAHSAGAYQMISLAQTAAEGRVRHVFPISTHIPAPYTGSKVMSAMRTMPDFLFKTVTKADSSLGNTWIGKAFDKLIAGQPESEEERKRFFCPRADREKVFQLMADEKIGNTVSAERFELDYNFGYSRIEGITVDFLAQVYRDCPVDVTWFTTTGDVFFGPKAAENIAKEMDRTKVEFVDVPGSTHADIYMRTEVWESMYSKIVIPR